MEASRISEKQAKIGSRKIEILQKRIIENIEVVENNVGEGEEFEVKTDDIAGSGV